MSNSLRNKLSKLRYQGKITDEEYKELIDKLDGHDEALLRLETCDDCISREAVITEIEDEDKLSFMGVFCSHDAAMGFRATIKDLPSVNPKRRKGKWFCLTPQQWQDGRTDTAWMCSECKEAARFIVEDNPYKICPNCGADMRGEDDDTR